MMKLKTVDELLEKIEICSSDLRKKFMGSDNTKTVVLCAGTGCLSSDSLLIKEKFEELILEYGLSDRVKINIAGCFGYCSQGPFVKIYPEDTLYHGVSVDDVLEIVESDLVNNIVVERLLMDDLNTMEKISKQDDIAFYKKQVRIALHACGEINPENINEALGSGAFLGFINALKMGREKTMQTVLDSKLRGRGGGGFPTGQKWRFAYAQDDEQKYVVCNGDEGDPGAFMDRSILEGNPISVIEGMMIAGYVIGANNGYFYVRAEYPIAVSRLRKAIEQARELGLLGEDILGTGFSFDLHIRLGAGAFVCGEETALLNSIEGQRGMPRPRPPYPAVSGLWGKPTVINNVETLATASYIMRVGLEEYSKIGTKESKGTKVFALGGKINNIGLVEVPMGTTIRELIYDIGGGIPNNKKFKAIQTGGPSGGCVTAKNLDSPIDFEHLVEIGSMMGSGGAIVMDEDNCMVDVAKFYMEFICDESCGKCAPCRIGTKRMLEILTKITEGKGELEDLVRLEELVEAVRDNSLCGLGQTAANPILSTIVNFKDEYLAHIVDKTCPAKVCKNLISFKVNEDLCKKCSLCAKRCPVGAISGVVGKTAFVIDTDKCIKCGLCLASCKFDAITKG